MADYANQHFLPKSYLKNFATDSDQKHIGIYVSSIKKFIGSGAIKPQCRKLYFYGEDGIVEKKLGTLEEGFKKLMLKIIQDRELPSRNDDNFQQVLLMWTITYLRNPVASDNTRAIMEQISKQASENRNDSKPFKFDPSRVDLVAMSLSYASMILPGIQDLDAVLLVNDTNIPFITSDNPINNYNQLGEKMRITSGVSGSGSIGFQSFFPISPSLNLMLYDPKIYRINGHPTSEIVLNEREVFSLNLLQLLNNIEVLYFDKKMTQKEILRLCEASVGFDRAGKVVAKTFHRKKSDESYDKFSGHYSAPVYFSAIELDLSFLGLTTFGIEFPSKNKRILARGSIMDSIKAMPIHLHAELIQQYEAMQNENT